MMIKQISQQILKYQNITTLLRHEFSKGFKSFMSLDNNVRAITFKDFQDSLGEQNKQLIEKFKKVDDYNLYEMKDGSAKIILDNYNKETGEVVVDNTKKVQGVNHFQMFYNFVLIVERDITLLVANQHFRSLENKNPHNFEGAKILTGNPESGVKALRFIQEIDPSYIQDITVVEKTQNFQDYFNLMSAYNQADISKVKIFNQSMDNFYYSKMAQNVDSFNPELYDLIDIDSYGSSINGIRSALKLIKDGGMISAIFGDMNTLCGPNIIKCYNNYNVLRSKMSALNENAVRIIYSSIQDAAVQNNCSIEPVFTFKSDFYIKVFFRVRKSGIEAQKCLEKKSMVYQCSACPNYHIHNVAQVEQQINENIQNGQVMKESSLSLNLNTLKVPEKCDQCGSEWKLNGPIWNGPLHDYSFLKEIQQKLNSTENETVFSKNKKMHIQSIIKLKSYIETVLEEQQYEKILLGFSIKEINGFFKANRFPSFDNIKRALARPGYKISRTMLEKDIYKSDAPLSMIFDTLKGWRIITDKLQNNPYKQGKTNNNNSNNKNNDINDNSNNKIDKFYQNLHRNVIQQDDKMNNIQQQEETALDRAMRKPQKFYPKFNNLTYTEKQNISQNINDPSYFDNKTQRTVFYPNPTENWGPKKPFSVVYTHKFEKEAIQTQEEIEVQDNESKPEIDKQQQSKLKNNNNNQ